jgi:hypothetical protein
MPANYASAASHVSAGLDAVGAGYAQHNASELASVEAVHVGIQQLREFVASSISSHNLASFSAALALANTCGYSMGDIFQAAPVQIAMVSMMASSSRMETDLPEEEGKDNLGASWIAPTPYVPLASRPMLFRKLTRASLDDVFGPLPQCMTWLYTELERTDESRPLIYIERKQQDVPLMDTSAADPIVDVAMANELHERVYLPIAQMKADFETGTSNIGDVQAADVEQMALGLSRMSKAIKILTPVHINADGTIFQVVREEHTISTHSTGFREMVLETAPCGREDMYMISCGVPCGEGIAKASATAKAAATLSATLSASQAAGSIPSPELWEVLMANLI